MNIKNNNNNKNNDNDHNDNDVIMIMVMELWKVVSNVSQQWLNRLCVYVRVNELQKWTLLGTANFLRRVLRL